MLFRGHEEDGLDLRVLARVHRRHLKLVLEVGNGAQAAHQDTRALLAAEMDQEAIEGTNLDMGPLAIASGDLLTDHLQAFFQREHRPLAVVGRDRDDQPVEHGRRAVDEVHVPARNRIEGARVDTDEGLM